MGYKDAIDHGETNVGLGMVPSGTKEDRLQRRIRQLKDRVRELESDNEKMGDLLVKKVLEIVELEDWRRRALPHVKDALEFFRAHCATHSGKRIRGQLEQLISEAEANDGQ